MTASCPQPRKRRYRSKAAAAKAHRRLNLPGGAKDRLEPYHCPCGFWHLTHPLRQEVGA